MNKVSLFLLSMMVLISSCSTSMRRYRSLAGTESDSTLADADLFGVKLDPAALTGTGKTLFDLTADAQSQFIKIMNIRYPENGRFLNSLRYDFLNGEEQKEETGFVSRNMRLVFSVNRKHEPGSRDAWPQVSPADRLEYLRISLTLDESYLTFIGWNLFTTEYASVDIGNVSFSSSVGTELSVSLPVKRSDSKGTASAGLTASGSRKEDQQVRYRYIRLNGRLNDSTIIMEEEGTRELDLAGNIIADISLKFRTAHELVTRIRNLYDSAGRANPPSRLIAEELVTPVPDIENIPEAIGAKLVFDYVYRNVISGSRTFPEWDDRIRYFRGHREKHLTLLSNADYVPSFFCIGSTGPGQSINFLSGEKSDGRRVKLVFTSYGEAAAFRSWLTDWCSRNDGKNIIVGGNLLKYGADPLTLKQIQDYNHFGVVPCYKY